MKVREFKPRRLDVRAFADSGETLEGEDPVSDFERLVESMSPDAPVDTASPVRWSVQGELRPRRGGPAEVWLHLQGSTTLALQCQRCLEAVDTPLSFDRSFLFVESESRAAELDAESEEDVLVLSRSFDLLALVEDELLLAAPIVPRHEVCPTPVKLSAGEIDDVVPDEPADTGEPNPFALLASLRKGDNKG